MIKVTNLSKKYGTLSVLSDVTFVLERGQKAALVGANGSGKSTLLKIIAGKEESDSGAVQCESGITIGYVEQDFNSHIEQTIFDFIKSSTDLKRFDSNYSIIHAIEHIFENLGLKGVSLERTLKSLSGGQKTRVALTAILLKKADVLLLDEPTNNLDIPALLWLEKFLRESDSGAIIVSHDSKFLDRVTNRVFDLDSKNHSIKVEQGTYSDYLDRKLKAIVRQKEQYVHQQVEIKRLTDEARQRKEDEVSGRNKMPSDNDKMLRGFKSDVVGKSLTKSAKVLEKRVGRMEKVEKIIERPPFRIDLEAEHSGGQADIELKEMEMEYKGCFALGPISLHLGYGKRYGFIGLNGSGKTTLLKIISGDLVPKSGEVEIGSAVRIGNLTQEHSDLPNDHVVFDYFSQKSGLDIDFVYNALVKFGLSEKNVRGKIGELSHGGRARLLLSRFAVRSVNTLILDEPTNHLDIEALTALEEVLADYRGTVILVSHDRYFLEKSRLDFLYELIDGKMHRIPDLDSYIKSAEKKANSLGV